MNIVYIIGNGFDIAQGLQTSYPDFYIYLQGRLMNLSLSNSELSLLRRLMQDINTNTTLWSDMEKGLGKFTDQTTSPEAFERLYLFLSDELQEYLQMQNDKFSPSEVQKKKFITDLTSPQSYLKDLDKIRYDKYLLLYKNSSATSFINRSIITFNYTKTIEKLAASNKIIHIHNILGNTIIFGVDNEDQISNIPFRENDNIKDFFIKGQAYSSIKTRNHIDCKQLIDQANVIVLFGVSLGDTDKRWWKIIGENLIKRRNLAIIQFLYKPTAINSRREYRIPRIERDQYKVIMQQMDINPTAYTDSVKERIFFIINSTAFCV